MRVKCGLANFRVTNTVESVSYISHLPWYSATALAVGFQDGISNPFVKIQDDDTKKRTSLPGQTVVDPGVLVLGQPGDTLAPTRAPWTKNGSFLSYRHLQQLVPEFNAFLKDVVLSSIVTPPLPSATDSEDIQKRVDFLGARLVGRWKSGMISVTSLFS